MANTRWPIGGFRAAAAFALIPHEQENLLKIINHTLGLPVICLDTGDQVGSVLRLVVDQVSGRIPAVAVARQWYQAPGFVLMGNCRAFGQSVVLVESGQAIHPLEDLPELQLHLLSANEARQRTCITETGRLLGAITDEAFDERTGVMNAYRLDVHADLGTGRTVYIPRSVFLTASASVVIVPDNVLESSYDTLDELVAVLEESPAEELPEETSAPAPAPIEESPVEVVKAPEEPVVETAPDYTLEPAQPTDAEASAAQERVMRALVIGQKVGTVVYDEQGVALAQPGDTITEEIADAALRAGKLYDLYCGTSA